MRTSDLILGQVRRALAAAFLLGGFAALLQFALPLFVLHAVDTAIPARSIETLALLALLATAALATLACLNSVRARILLRAGLWLEHTLGCELLDPRHRRPASQTADDVAALGRLRAGATDGPLLSALDTPWQVMMIAGLALIDWRIAAVAATAAGVLVLRMWLALPEMTGAADASARLAERKAAWWYALAAVKDAPAPAAAVVQWERLNRDHVASAYGLFSNTTTLADFTRFVRTAAQVAALATGAFLVMEGEMTTGALVASVLLLWRVLEPVETLMREMPSVAAARSAWTRLSQAVSALPSAPAKAADAAVEAPRLHISGPLAAGIAAVAVFFAAGVVLTATTRIGNIVALTGKSLFETKLTAVFPSRKGVSAQVFVKEGATVAKGELLATLDTRTLDARIVSLKLKAATANIELNALRQDLANMTAPSAPPLKSRAPLEKLEARIADLGRQSRDLVVAIASAEEELTLSRIVAPVAGRVLSLDVRPGMPVEPDAPLFTLITADDTLLHRLLAPLGVASLGQRIASLFGIEAAHARAAD